MNSNEIDIHKELKKYFGFSQFKVQEQVIKCIKPREYLCDHAYRRRKITVLSIACFDSRGAIVVSPLIALMKNQVDAIRSLSSENGVAHVLNSSLTKLKSHK
jgi:ATP-dependent DNA helicase RecQ